MQDICEAECKRKGIHHLLAAANANNSEYVGASCTNAYNRCVNTNADCGFPLCLNSKEKAEFVGKQFFDLCCTCYGIALAF